MHYFLPLVSRCFTLGRWSGAKKMMSEMLARTILEQRKEVPLVDWHGKRWSTVWMKFQLKDKNVVPERWSLHRKKFSKKMSEEKKGDCCGRVTEKQSLTEERKYRRLNRHRNCNSKTTRLQKISGKKRWSASKRPRALSIRPNILVWNSGYSMRRMEQYFPVRWTNQSQVSRFQVSRENTSSNGGLFYLCFLALELLDDSEVEINDVLGEGDNITFIVRI